MRAQVIDPGPLYRHALQKVEGNHVTRKSPSRPQAACVKEQSVSIRRLCCRLELRRPVFDSPGLCGIVLLCHVPISRNGPRHGKTLGSAPCSHFSPANVSDALNFSPACFSWPSPRRRLGWSELSFEDPPTWGRRKDSAFARDGGSGTHAELPALLSPKIRQRRQKIHSRPNLPVSIPNTLRCFTLFR